LMTASAQCLQGLRKGFHQFIKKIQKIERL